MMDRHQLQCGDMQRAQVVDDRIGGHPQIGPLQALRDLGMANRHAPHVGLVDHRAVPGNARRLVVAPGEGGVDDDTPREVASAVTGIQ